MPAGRKDARRAVRLAARATVALVAGVLAAPRAATALDAALATECIACQFPAVVSVAAQCTGLYMGEGMILTAAHCTDDVREGRSRAFFGEDIGAPAFAAVIERCVRHPDGRFARNALGEDSYEGVDVAFCTLDDEAPLPDVPLVPPLLPEGCERDWLAHQVAGATAVLTAVGFGCAGQDGGSWEACDAGVKRQIGVQLVRQIDYAGTGTKLELQRGGAVETGLMAGDSGGPYFAQLPDGTWRLVGVHHGANAGVAGAFVEAVAPYVHWLESASDVDVTPCHDFAGGAWVESGACAPGTPVGAVEIGGDWANDCRSGVSAAAVSVGAAACAALGSDAAGLHAPASDLDHAAQRVLAVPPARRAARLAQVTAELEPRAVFPFLADELPGMAPLASLREAVSADHAGHDEDDAGLDAEPCADGPRAY
jgi:hypothetical protein